MQRHFANYADAFEKFDTGRDGTLSYNDFQNLMNKIHEIAEVAKPTF